MFQAAKVAISLALIVVAAFGQSPESLLATGHADQAIEVLSAQLQKTPTALAHNQLCRAYFEFGAYDAGISYCERATALAADNELFHLWLGRIYGEKADHAGFLSAAGLAKKVRTEFERAVELQPENWEARTDLAEFYLEAPGIVGGGKDKAVAQADRIAELNPAMSHWVRARVAEKNKDTAAAEKEYRAAIEASHGGARAWLNLAGFYRHTNRLDEMEHALHSMDSSAVDFPGALVDAAGLLLRTERDFPLAVRFLRRYLSGTTVEEAPVFKAQTMLGDLMEKQGDRVSAVEQYRAALALAHSYRPALEGLKRTGH